MTKKMNLFFLGYLLIISLVLGFGLTTFLSSNDLVMDISDRIRTMMLIPKPKEARIPTKEDICRLEEKYQELFLYLENRGNLKTEIIELYEKEKTAKGCSIPNKYFNMLDDKYSAYMEELNEYKEHVLLCEEAYNEYVEMLESIPKYAKHLRKQKYLEFIQKISSLHAKLNAEKETYKSDEEEVKRIHTAAKRLADDLVNEYLPIISRLVTQEGGNTPFIEQCYIANVVENRVKSPKFADTVYGVIYSEGQYEPVITGSINLPASPSVTRNMEQYLRGHVETGMPDNVLFQSRFSQGDGTWKIMPSGHHFCYKN